MSDRFRVLSGGNHADTILAKALQAQQGARRSPVLDTYTEPYNKVVPLPYNYQSLIRIALLSEVPRTVNEAIIKEVTRNGYENKPKFESKCLTCGAEYHAVKQQCKCGSTKIVFPDAVQKQLADAFLDHPNRDDTTPHNNESILRYMLAVDDHWVSFQQGDPATLTPPTMYVEDSSFMRVVWDEQTGRIGNGEYFCPICTRDNPALMYKKGEHCPNHPDTPLEETAYVYDKGGIKARFARGDCYHGMVDPMLPGFYGNPRLLAALRVVLSVTAMDKFNLDTYATGKLAQIIGWSGTTQDDVNKTLADAAQQAKTMQTVNPVTGDVVAQAKTLFLGLPAQSALSKVDAMPPSEKMQSLDWWRLWREVYCGLYGVTPVFVGIVESGKTGNNPRMQIDVDNNTTESFQHLVEDVYNLFIYPKLGISDWEFKYNPVEEKDEMQDVAVLQAKVNLVVTATNAGMTAELTDEQEVKVSGKPLTPQERFDMQQAQLAAQQPEGEQQPEDDKGFPKEKLFPTEKSRRIKSQYMVTELEKE